MYGKKPGHRLQLNNKTPLHYQIRNKVSNHNTSEVRRNRHLLIYRQPTRLNGKSQCVFIDLLKISRPKFTVDIHRATNNFPCQILIDHNITYLHETIM